MISRGRFASDRGSDSTERQRTAAKRRRRGLEGGLFYLAAVLPSRFSGIPVTASTWFLDANPAKVAAGNPAYPGKIRADGTLTIGDFPGSAPDEARGGWIEASPNILKMFDSIGDADGILTKKVIFTGHLYLYCAGVFVFGIHWKKIWTQPPKPGTMSVALKVIGFGSLTLPTPGEIALIGPMAGCSNA